MICRDKVAIVTGAASNGMGRSIALTLARKGAKVAVNVIAPGPVPGAEGLAEAIEYRERGAAWRERTNTSPQDIAESVAFLSSDAGQFVSRCVVPFLYH